MVGVACHGEPVPAAQRKERKGAGADGCCRKLQEALQSLAEIYGRFTEGFDMPDLREARALLEETRG